MCVYIYIYIYIYIYLVPRCPPWAASRNPMCALWITLYQIQTLVEVQLMISYHLNVEISEPLQASNVGDVVDDVDDNKNQVTSKAIGFRPFMRRTMHNEFCHDMCLKERS